MIKELSPDGALAAITRMDNTLPNSLILSVDRKMAERQSGGYGTQHGLVESNFIQNYTCAYTLELLS